MRRRPPRSTPFPYTTLFRSGGDPPAVPRELGGVGARAAAVHRGDPRSEEHTSELQSQPKLVCRLLLEKRDLLRSLNPILLSIYSRSLSMYQIGLLSSDSLIYNPQLLNLFLIQAISAVD